MRKILWGLLLLIMVLSTGIMPAYADDGVTVTLDGAELVFDVPAQIINGRTMVPMRKIFESMGATVDWAGETRTINAKKGEIAVVMQIDNTIINVSGTDITLDVPPQLVDGRTLVPARAVAESLKAKVDWDADTKTVIITTQEDSNFLGASLAEKTEFACDVGATISYGYDDIWTKTAGTGYAPKVKPVTSAYKGQTVLISPIYKNFATDANGNAKVTYTISVRKPDGREATIDKDIIAIDGKTTEKEVKAMSVAEVAVMKSEPSGTYTFTLVSNDVVSGNTLTNTFDVEVSDYKYVKNEFTSKEELLDFIYNYGTNPNPDRLIDAMIYAQKSNLITYPIIFNGFIEIFAKNAYLGPVAVSQFTSEFGNTGIEALIVIENSAMAYLNAINANMDGSVQNVLLANDIGENIMLYGATVGTYKTAASYDAVKLLITCVSDGDFSDSQMIDYDVPGLAQLANKDALFRAYCQYMKDYDSTVDAATKEKLDKILN